jgi:hypothetical protein
MVEQLVPAAATKALTMTGYRIYLLANDDHATKRIDIDCADDDAAIEIAKQYIDGRDIELWQRDRRIAQFDRKPE